MPDQAQGGLISPFLRDRRLRAARPYLRGRVLDFGCGVGALAFFCDPATYLGIDRDVDSIEIARRLHPCHTFATGLPAEGAYDTIVGLAVIEHIAAPAELVARLKALLAPGGRLVLTTPHPAFEWLHELGAKVHLCSAEAAEEHESLLDASDMRRLAGNAAMSLVVSRRFLLGLNQLFVLQ